MSNIQRVEHEINGRELTISRTLNAPRELVFEAFTQPEHLMKWWGPKEWPVVVCTVDLRPGGKWRYCMRSTEGQKVVGIAIYEEIVRPERLVLVDAFSDAEGNINPDLPTSKMTAHFADVGGQTRLTMTTVYASEQDLQTVLSMGVIEGISEAVSQLEDLLAQLQTA